MKDPLKSQINKIYGNLQKKYKVGPRKINFKDDAYDQIAPLLDKIQKTANKEIELYEDDDSSYGEKLIPLETLSDGISSEDFTESEDDDGNDNSYESDDSQSNDNEVKTAEKGSEMSEENDDKIFNQKFETARDVFKVLDKPVGNKIELDEEIESDYLENLKDE